MPRNLPKDIDVAERTKLEDELIALCRSTDHKRRKGCALYGAEPAPETGWRGWWQAWQLRRLRRLRKSWEDIAAGRRP
jgi:hypothetical protein